MPTTRKQCGAKCRDGNECLQWAMPNGRCKMHGGKSTGAPKNNQNARKHGIYSKQYTKSEQELIKQAGEGELCRRLILSRIRLKRALEASNKAQHSTLSNTNESLTYLEIMLTTLGRIGALEKSKMKLLRAPYVVNKHRATTKKQHLNS